MRLGPLGDSPMGHVSLQVLGILRLSQSCIHVFRALRCASLVLICQPTAPCIVFACDLPCDIQIPLLVTIKVQNDALVLTAAETCITAY